LSLLTSLSSTPTRETPAHERSRARRRLRPLRLILFLLVIAVAALFEPNTFRFLAGQLIRFEAWRSGVTARIGGMDGSLLEPLTVRNSVWIYESSTGPVTRVEITAATAEFSWRNLLPRSSGRWFRRLTINGLTGKIQFPLEAAGTPASTPSLPLTLPHLGGHWMPAPERIEARGVDFIFQSNADYVRLADTEFTLSNVEAGTIRAGQIAIKQPWLNRTFRDVRGTTAIQDAKVEVANLTLEPGVEVRGFSAELDDLARGRLNLDMRLAAFGGSIRVSARTLSPERPFGFEATGTFSQIGVAKLATFLGVSDAAGGTIKEGKFTFRGPPQQVAKATASLRLEATNFQWNSRQWDALVLGATLMDGRVQIPELALAQGHNRLNLTGEMPLPTPGVAWWQSEFSVNIAAKIDNLTELSALMLPEFQFAAGKADIDGSIRGKDQQFNGQLIVSGSKLVWHNAPIEELHAGVKLNGNEFQITNLSLFNNGDYLRGHGVVNIIGDKQYWGEIRASIEDLDKYAALLEKPIVPEPLAGGAIIDWSGEGSAKGHSGKFSARLRKLRSLGTTAALLHPINADLDGTYAPGTMQFSRFLLSDDHSSFTANVGVGNKALSLQGIKLYHKQALWLEGDALLPLDVWNAWPNTTLAKLLDDQTVSKINLTAYNLGLREASLLTGWKFPIEGIVLGNLVAEGPLTGLKTSGKLTLSKAQIPLGWSGDALTQMEGEVTFDGQTMQVKKWTTRHPSGLYSATGQLDFPNLRDPSLNLAVSSADATLACFAGENWSAQTRVAGTAQIVGPLSAAAIGGDWRLLSVAIAPRNRLSPSPPDLTDLFLGRGIPALPPVFSLDGPPWSAWKFDVGLRTKEPVSFSWSPDSVTLPGDRVPSLEVDLRLAGTASAPALVGTAKIGQGGRAAVGQGELSLKKALLNFREGFSASPSVLAEAQGFASHEPFAIQLTGTLQHPMRTFLLAPPLTEKIILAALQEPKSALEMPDIFDLHVPPALRVGVEISAWATIPAPDLPVPPATPEVSTPAPSAAPAPTTSPLPAAVPVPAAVASPPATGPAK